ncbi:MAG: 50S ribosomal protein L18 [Candidatus Fraserbacteria bacterium RBG_16_55_9]|uniref:Large ribosomal subunit protein uL18 n=1 Tax=Fraserbacteria sp. (strain RBG_16_55_9) TaxID=1817864 RepID=A0A1F5UPC2_FRAXR|nr:MAG: 50S ribosomal protein L18 [Candidatus Fraserbacteria bacterium RBG_16_55_9]
MAQLIREREAQRVKRHRRIRQKVVGTLDHPRLSVYKSARHLYAQLIDDLSGHTLVYVSTLDKALGKGCNIEAAKSVGKLLAERARKEGIKKVVFDRGGYPYHGVVKALAESAREGGLVF